MGSSCAQDTLIGGRAVGTGSGEAGQQALAGQRAHLDSERPARYGGVRIGWLLASHIWPFLAPLGLIVVSFA